MTKDATGKILQARIAVLEEALYDLFHRTDCTSYQMEIIEGVLPERAEVWPMCSGDPACCPENAGYGCCKPNPSPEEKGGETVPENVVSLSQNTHV
jgi:hypothetical protein